MFNRVLREIQGLEPIGDASDVHWMMIRVGRGLFSHIKQETEVAILQISNIT